MHAILLRTHYGPKQTLGEFRLYDQGKLIFSCKTLELPWLENKNRVSCIPEGIYKTRFRTVGKYAREALHVITPDGEEVPGRVNILIHKGNFYTDILGCLLLGAAHTDINRDGLKDVTHSEATVNALLAIAHEFTLEIVDARTDSRKVRPTALNLRNDSGEVIAPLPRGTELEVAERKGKLLAVTVAGWVHADYVE